MRKTRSYVDKQERQAIVSELQNQGMRMLYDNLDKDLIGGSMTFTDEPEPIIFFQNREIF